MTDPIHPPEHPSVPPPGGAPPPMGTTPTAGGPAGTPPARHAPQQVAGLSLPSIPALDAVGRDGGAWAAAAVVITVLGIVLADLIYAVSSTGSAVAVSGVGLSSSGVSFKVHLLAFTGWATLGVAVALLIAVGLVRYVRPSAPAPFRPLAVLAVGALALAVAVFAVVRAIVWVSYGHDYGVAAFVDALATIPIALVTAALALARTDSAM